MSKSDKKKRRKQKQQLAAPKITEIRLDRIGYMDAESDAEFLSECFVEIPQYDRITDVTCPESVLAGRTGAGKSAVIWAIKTRESRTISISPKDLAIDYIVGSDIIQLCNKLNVKLNIFFEYLWRHVLIVELLKFYFSEQSSKSFSEGIQGIFGFGSLSVAERQAKDYLERYGSSFWQETIEKITELTTGMESEVISKTGLTMEYIQAFISGKRKIKESKREEYARQIQSVVNRIQIRELSNLSDVLSSKIFGRSNAKYYILIDRLDDDWVDEGIRYKLIRALIETTQWMRKLKRVKIVVALRADYLERTFNVTKDSGFQREKYNDQISYIRWQDKDLRTLMHRRFEYVLRSSRSNLQMYDIVPKDVGQKNFDDYVIARTMGRPRDLIAFINEILKEYRPGDTIGKTKIEVAERRHSKSRVEALIYEWQTDYPCVEKLILGLGGCPRRITFSDLVNLKGDEIITEIAALSDKNCEIIQLANRVFANEIDQEYVMKRVVCALYNIGCIGFKETYSDQVVYSDDSKPFLDVQEIGPGMTFVIHTMLWSRLGVGRPVKGEILG